MLYAPYLLNLKTLLVICYTKNNMCYTKVVNIHYVKNKNKLE